jgi:hypothetical protein
MEVRCFAPAQLRIVQLLYQMQNYVEASKESASLYKNYPKRDLLGSTYKLAAAIKARLD